MNSFSKKDLKTGHRVTMNDGLVYTVFLDADLVNCHSSKNVLVCTEGCTWRDLDEFTEDLVNGDDSIVEVRSFWAHALNGYYGSAGKLLWEREKEPSPEEIEQRKLKERYEAVKKELEELGKQIGVVE